ncbi:translation initiation factor IF-3 [bacterium]|nr:translation initiation factor IF-3 [bacterium]
MKKRFRLNHEIRAAKVRLLDESGQQLGILSLSEALSIAQERGYDLAEVSPSADPPVAKLIDWGKYQYEQGKLAQKSRKKQKSIEVKQIRLGLKIDEHDLNVKIRSAQKFLNQGNKVKVNLRFRGREITHPELAKQVLDNFFSSLDGLATMEQAPSLSGREMSMVLNRSKDAKTENE